MNKLHRDRLTKLADFLNKLPRQKFNFAVIAQEDGKPFLEALKAGKTECGTVACAIGWMPAVFPRTFKWEASDLTSTWRIVQDRNTLNYNFGAAADFFGISHEQASYLFDPGTSELGNDATPKQVAKHIRRFIKYAE